MRRGFTLIELLVVVVIIGVLVTMVSLSFSTGSDVARVKTATRGVMQMSRYARAMAVLHQTPVELVFAADGTLRVAQVSGGGDSIVSAQSFGLTNSEESVAAALERADKTGKRGGSGREVAPKAAEAAEAEPSEGGGTSYVMADLNIEKKYEQVSFRFDGFTDTMEEVHKGKASKSGADKEKEPGEGEDQTFRVKYMSNGTCRPYRVRVVAAGDESCVMQLSIDVLGAGKVEDDQ